MKQQNIQHVSDTSLWVAVYRHKESIRKDALFNDPYADQLSGEFGKNLAAKMINSKYTEWNVIIRTYLIDKFINELIADGVDTILNLGAGLDTRPYRMNLPAHVNWIQVDFPHIIEYKQKILINEKPSCKLESVKIDLSDEALRRSLFSRVNEQSKKVAVLTEGLIPYFTPEQVKELATDLRQQDKFRYWILDYYSTQVQKYLKSRRANKAMGNAPFQFFVPDYFDFFKKLKWQMKQIEYLPEVSKKLNREIPMPLIGKIFTYLFQPKDPKYFQYSGYVILAPDESR